MFSKPAIYKPHFTVEVCLLKTFCCALDDEVGERGPVAVSAIDVDLGWRETRTAPWLEHPLAVSAVLGCCACALALGGAAAAGLRSMQLCVYCKWGWGCWGSATAPCSCMDVAGMWRSSQTYCLSVLLCEAEWRVRED